jgi:AraC-like DNA-binding protein
MVAFSHSNHVYGLNRTKSGLEGRPSEKLHSSLPIPGMARDKAQGKWISRPPLSEHTQRRIKELRRQDVSIRKIATQIGVSKATVQKYLAYTTSASAGRRTARQLRGGIGESFLFTEDKRVL